jgi:NTP pyrophosphatase (non-canonical NTP hydrolase)
VSWRGILSIEDVTEEINRFASERDWNQFHTPKNIASSISIEAAELLECFQWSDPTVPDVLVDEELLGSVEEEIADILIYALRMCSILDMDAIDVMEKKLEKNEGKYPVNASKGNAIKYDRLSDAS